MKSTIGVALLAIALTLVGCGEAVTPSAVSGARASGHEGYGLGAPQASVSREGEGLAAPQQQASNGPAWGSFFAGMLAGNLMGGLMSSNQAAPAVAAAAPAQPTQQQRRWNFLGKRSADQSKAEKVAKQPTPIKPVAPPAAQPPKFTTPAVPKPYVAQVQPSAPSKFSGPSGYSSTRQSFSSSPSRRR